MKTLFVRVSSAIAALASGADAHFGKKGCPCLADWRAGLPPTDYYLGQGQYVGRKGVDPTGTGTLDPEVPKYTGTYGARCGYWDVGDSTSCAGATPPDWCLAAWCWVDPKNCDVEKHETGYVPMWNLRTKGEDAGGALPPVEDRMNYSLATCRDATTSGATRSSSFGIAALVMSVVAVLAFRA